MFDTMKTAKKIRTARISLNLTQMNLADAMEVSYQAVSNWERGNSMPDISKLEQLCGILHITMEELLSSDSTTHALNKIVSHAGYNPAHNVIHKRADTTADDDAALGTTTANTSNVDTNLSSDNDILTIEELQAIAPLLPPDKVETFLDDNRKHQNEENIDLAALTALAPYLDETYLDELVKDIHECSLYDFVGLAPFLSEKTLYTLVLAADRKTDQNAIAALAPFLSEDILDTLVTKNLHWDSLRELVSLAPHLSEKTLDKLVLQADPQKDINDITSLAPFLSEDTLDALITKNLHWDSLRELVSLAPHLSEKTLDKLVLQADPQKDMNGIVALVPFLSEGTLDALVMDNFHWNSLRELAPLAPHLSEETLDKLVLRAELQNDLNGLSALAPFLSDKALKELARQLIQKKDLNGLKTLTPYL